MYVMCPYGHQKYMSRSACLFGGHMVAKPTWPPIYVNLVAIWQDAGPDQIIYTLNTCTKPGFLPISLNRKAN